MIRAILKDGLIKPAEPLPADWADGQELIVERQSDPAAQDEIERWARELEEADSTISHEDAATLERALADVERQSKDAVRREWGLG